jgi:hypothetical protein
MCADTVRLDVGMDRTVQASLCDRRLGSGAFGWVPCNRRLETRRTGS